MEPSIDSVKNEIALMVMIKGVTQVHQDCIEQLGLNVSDRTVRRIYEERFDLTPTKARAQFIRAAMFEFLRSDEVDENVYPHIEDVYRKLLRTAKHRLNFWMWSEDFISYKQRKPGDWWAWFTRWNDRKAYTEWWVNAADKLRMDKKTNE